MRHSRKRIVSVLLTLIMVLQLCPAITVSAASSFENKTPGDPLFQGESNVDRNFVSETAYPLAPGVTEYVTYTNEPSGLNQNVDYFCEIDLSQAEIMAGYAGMETILTDKTISWRMQTVSDQAKATQSYFRRSSEYADATIVAALNADYYNMATGQPSGILIIDGVTYNKPSSSYYFAIDKDGKALISNSTAEEDLAKLQHAVAGGTLLVKDGEVNVGQGGRNVTYTAIGLKADGTVVSMVCYGQRYPVSCGYTQFEVAQMMKARGCVTALLLDGSGSSTFVSRREGDSEVVTRNNPSDGQERQVSSSIFIISRVKSDGVFDHASLSPANEVYTPNSQVQFTAVGADKSGAPAPLPADVSWTVDAAYGTINSSTGLFTSTGTTGDVTVSLYSGGQVVGTTTITIANPDQITFAETTASMGEGDTSDLGLRVYYKQREVHYKNGDFTWTITPTQYSRRQWTGSGIVYETIVETAESSPDQMAMLTVGTVTDNQLTCAPVYKGRNTNTAVPEDYVLKDIEKTASAITATVTVTSTANSNVSGTVTLEACKDPVVAMDFEGEGTTVFHGMTSGGSGDFYGQFIDGVYHPVQATDEGAISGGTGGAYYVNDETIAASYDYACVSYINSHTGDPQTGSAEIVSREDGYPVRFGEHSLKLDYTIPGKPLRANAGICFGFTEEINLADLGNPTRIGLWVYVPEGTPNLWMRLRYRDGSGNSSQVDFTAAEIWKPNNLANNADGSWHYFEADISKLQTPVTIPAGMSIRLMYAGSNQSTTAWGSPQGFVKAQTDDSGNIIWVDRTSDQLAGFTAGRFSNVDLRTYGSPPPADGQYTLPTGDVVQITKVPIPEYLGEFDSSGYWTDEQVVSGTLYFDNLTYVYGSTPEDTSAPDIESLTVRAGGGETVPLSSGLTLISGDLDIESYFSDSTDANRNNTGVASASLYVDGHLVEGDGVIVNDSTLRVGIRLANGEHTIRISVVDNYGNEATETYTVTVNDPEGDGAPVEVIAQETTAVLGGKIHLDFYPRDNAVNAFTVSANVPEAYVSDYEFVTAENCTVTGVSYNSASQTLSFTVNGSVNSGAAATLILNIPTTVPTGTKLTIATNGNAGGETFTATPSWAVTAPYTVTSGQMVAGLSETCWFQINYTASGESASNVTLYSGGNSLGVSGADGRVPYTPIEGQTSVTVMAKDAEGSVSAEYIASIYQPAGNDDGTPTRVWRNAADADDSLNVSWLANPLYAANAAQLRLADSATGFETVEARAAECELVTFTDGSAAYVCGAEVTGLTPGTTYYYQVGDGAHWSEVKSFTTNYVNTGINALIMGDIQESYNANLGGILEKTNANSLDLVIQTGDLVDNGGSYANWNSAQSMLSGLETGRLFAIGNHDQNGTVDVNEVIYNQQGGSEYYTMEVGNVFIATIAYNSFSETNLQKMVTDANASNATWKILVTHQPPYYTNVGAGMGESTQQALTEACQEAGIDVVLSGHDHSYARTEPLWDGEVVAADEGITYYICGSLGDKGYTVSDTEGFHFVQATNDYNAIYLTLSTTDSTLTIDTYDYTSSGVSKIDTFTKTKGDGSHTHSYTWDGSSRLTCSCGYSISSAAYTGYAAYTTPEGKSGTVYLNAGKLMTGVFAVGEDTVHHAGEDGLLHNSETVNSAQCWEDGYLGCWCKDCNTFYQLSGTRRQGHLYDENHVCTRQVFNMDTFTYETCGHQGKDIATLDMKLAYLYGFYTGEAKRPAVTITDTLPDGSSYVLKPQSTYGDYMPYWDNNVDVGTATVRIVGYSDGPYYGEATLTFDIVPNNVTAEDFTVTTTSNSVHLQWEPSLGATHYIVYQMVNGAWTRLGIVDEAEYTATGLSQGSYQFMIRPFATVDGKDYYSTKNSDVVTADIQSGGISFQENGTVTKTYGDGLFTNAASQGDSTEGFTYSSADSAVATVNAATGEVTIVGAGSTVITAVKGDVTGQYRLTVQPKEVTLVWSGTGERTYDGQASQVTASAEGLLEGDIADVTVTGGDAKDAGTHTASAAIDNPNYTVPADNTVSYTILPASITSLTWSNTELTYTGQLLAPTAAAVDGLVEGDSVEFSVPAATEAGTYVVSAVSKNPNYVVAEDAENKTCTFIISMPEIQLSGADSKQVTWYLDGTTVRLSGFVSNAESEITVTVTATLSSGSTSASAEVSAGGESSVALGGVSYSVDASQLTVKPVNVKLSAGATVPTVPEIPELTEENTAAMTAAANSQSNKFENIVAAAAPSTAEIVEQALADIPAEEKPGSVTLEISQKLDVLDYTPGKSYKVDITPVYTVKTGEGDAETTIATGTLTNDQIAVPVQVTLQVPAEITLDAHTYIRHERSDGRIEYIRPSVDNDAKTVTFQTAGFSVFEVVSDSRTGSVTFDFGETGTQERVFTPEDIGKALPTVTVSENQRFDGWRIGDQVYTELTDALLTALSSGETVTAEAVITDTTPTPPSGGGSTSSTYAITVQKSANGTVTASKARAEEGDSITLTVSADEGYVLDTLTVTDKSGDKVALTDKGSGKYTFKMPDAAVTVQAVFQEEDAVEALPFTDVAESDWYYEAVVYASSSGMMNGVSSDRFAPNSKLTRGMIAQVLYNLEDASDDAASAFADVAAGAWYADAVNWAASSGIVSGYGDGRFGPEDNITRQQMAVILYNYAKYKGYDLTAAGDTSVFTDANQVSSWADEAVSWAVGAGLLNGKNDGRLDPTGTATRAEVATILMRFVEYLAV